MRPIKRALLVAVFDGHDLTWDPPAALSGVERWTCARCHRALLRCGTTVYGSVITELCSFRSGEAPNHPPVGPRPERTTSAGTAPPVGCEPRAPGPDRPGPGAPHPT